MKISNKYKVNNNIKQQINEILESKVKNLKTFIYMALYTFCLFLFCVVKYCFTFQCKTC